MPSALLIVYARRMRRRRLELVAGPKFRGLLLAALAVLLLPLRAGAQDGSVSALEAGIANEGEKRDAREA